MKIKKQHIKVFLEGIEFKYVNSLVITEGEGAPPSFEITTNYVRRLQNILPKTLCHVFYHHDGDYRFILEGELTGVSFVKNAMQKIAKLQFTSTTLNWRNHYILAKDTDVHYFDRGAFLVLNAELPLTHDDTYVSQSDSSSPTFGPPTPNEVSDTTKFVANAGNYNPVAAFKNSNWEQFYNKIIAPINYPKLVELAAPKFPQDMFFALAAQEGAKDTHFSKNEASAVYNNIAPNYYRASLELRMNPEEAVNNLYTYADQTGPEKSRDAKTLYGRTGWGILQVMGFEMHATPDFTQIEIDRLINGVEYKELCQPQTVTPDLLHPRLSQEYKLYYDTKSKKYFEIPSVEYLIALQAKAAYQLLKRKVAFFGEADSLEKGDLVNRVHPKKVFKAWMGWNSTGEAYAEEIWKYYLKAIEYLKTGNYANNQGVGADAVSQAYPSLAQDPGFEGVDYNANLYRTSYEQQPWIRTFVEGGELVTSVNNIIGKYAADNDLETLIKGVLDALAITSSYYKTVHDSLRLGIEKICLVDSEPARRLFKINSMANFLLQQSHNTQTGSILSGMDLIKLITDSLGYSIIELATPIKDTANVVITPDTTFMTPLKCNTFFSDQVNDVQFVRNMEAEPTRYTAFTNQLGMLHSPGSRDQMDLAVGYVTPRIPNIDDTSYVLDGTNKLRQYTYEESYRGVHAQLGNTASSPFEEMLFNQFDNTTAKDLDSPENTMSGFINPYWKSIVDGMFLKQRYASRSTIITTSYNPERVCGFPACVIDDELPTIVGKIASITTTISADGNTTSQIMLTHCHTHWDDDLDTVDYKSTYNYANDAIPAMDHIWTYLTDDPEKKYRWFNIGKLVYSNLMGVENSIDSSVLSFAEESFLVGDSIPTQDWTNYNKALANSFKNMRKRYNSFNDKSKFSDSVIKRDFLSMSDFWLKLTGEKIPQPHNYRKGANLLLYQESVIRAQQILDQGYNYQPFLIERLSKVREVLNYLTGDKNDIQ